MKKRTYIVATMAVAMAAFVGCQKDFDSMADFEKAGNAVERPVIGSVELTVGDAVTRAGAGSNGVVDSTGYNWQFEEGDQVGAALVDKVSEEDVTGYAKKDGSGETWSYFEYVTGVTKDVDGVKNQLFTQTFADDQLVEKHTGEAFYEPDNDQIWTNYPYTAGAGAKVFTSQATLVEGHYVFYAPYNAGNGTRGPLMVTLPVKQTVKETSEGKSNSAVDEFFKGTAPAIVDMKYLSAADTKSVGSNLAALFAYPQFTIVNNYNGYLFDGTTVPATGTYLSTEAESKQYTMKIMQIELYPGEEKADAFTYKRALDVVKLYEAINEDKTNVDSQDRWYTDNSRKEFITAATAAVLAEESDYNVDTFDFKDEIVKFEENIVKEFKKEEKRIVLDFGEGKELAPGAKFTFNAVVPADNYTECGLYARILVEIEGAKYYILTNDVEGNAYNEKGKLVNMAKADGDYAGHAIVAKTGLTVGTDAYDYRFVDRKKHGSETVVLVRGQRYPAAEMNADQSAGPKTGIAGDLLTINLVGGQSQAAFAAYVEPEEEKKEDRGIFDNDEFIAYLQKVHNDAPLTQVRNYEEAEKDVNKFKLADENEVILDAKLVKALAQAQQTQYTTFIDNLPIGEGVVVEAVEMDSTPYEFLFTTTVDGKEYSYTVKYEFEDDGKFNDKADALVSGINVITAANQTLAAGNVENAVVFVKADGDKTITIKNPAGINSINVEGEVTINVEATAEVTAPIVAPESTVKINEGSKGLTNPENVFGAVENQALVAINFVDDKDTPVVVSYKRNGWGTTPIDAATKVNYVTIDAAGQNVVLPTETASFDLVKNLTKVTIVFGDNIASLLSAGETVTLGDNIKAVKGAKVWNAKDEITGTKVSHKADTFEPTEGNGVKITKR